MFRGAWVVLVVGLILLGAAGCWNPFSQDDNGGGNGGGQYDRKTPENLLNFFAAAYKDKDVTRYGESIDDNFAFTFLERDYGDAGVDSITPYWGKTEDVERTGRMFSSVKTFDIGFDFVETVMPWYECTGTIMVGSEEQTVQALCTLRKPDIKVTVDMDEPELTTFWVNKSLLDIKVIKDRYNPDLWTILSIEELDSEEQPTR